MAMNWSKLKTFYVGVPHQRPAFIVDPRGADPDKDAGDTYFAGDHDLSGVYVVDSQAVAESLMQPSLGAGRQARHQAARIAAIVEQELIEQGVIAADAYDDED